MTKLSRRKFLTSSGVALAGVALAACGASNGTTGGTTPAAGTAAAGGAPAAGGAAAAGGTTAAGGASGAPVAIKWWDHFQPLSALHKTMWDNYSTAHANVKVEYTEYNPKDLGQALQLAYSSKQMPDVHTLAGLGVPVSRLVAEGWFSPLTLSDEARNRLPKESLLEGNTIFGGKLYSFPLFSFRQYTSLDWFNKTLMADSGFDPEVGPKTWDDFRKAANTITKKGGGIFGWIQGIQFADRMTIHLEELAQVAGAQVAGPGGSVTDLKTGEYVYGSDPFVQALEFMVSLQKDGSLFPASSSLDARNARARWATGVSGMFLDGPWNIGVINGNFKEFTDKVGVAQIPMPSAQQASYIYKPPIGGEFWVSSQSKNPAVASQILEAFTTPEYYISLAERMDQPPLDLSAVDKATVHPTYKQAMTLFEERVKLAPSPVVRNPAVADVLGEMKPITPGLGQIIQGAFSGDVQDYKATLKEYSDKLTAERERAVKVVQGKGAKVSLDDWKFANWQPGQDYTAESYT